MRPEVDDARPVVTITLVGPIRVRVDGETRHLTRTEEALVAVLSSFEDGVDKQQLLRAIWGDAGSDASTSLRQLVSKLRHEGLPIANNRNRAKVFWNHADFAIETDLDPLWNAGDQPGGEAQRVAQAILEHPEDLFSDVSAAASNVGLSAFLDTRRRTVIRRARRILDIDPRSPSDRPAPSMEHFRSALEPEVPLRVSAMVETPRSAFRLRSMFIAGCSALIVGAASTALGGVLSDTNGGPQGSAQANRSSTTTEAYESGDSKAGPEIRADADPAPNRSSAGASQGMTVPPPRQQSEPRQPSVQDCGASITRRGTGSCQLARAVARAYPRAEQTTPLRVTDPLTGRTWRFTCRSSTAQVTCQGSSGKARVVFPTQR